MKISNPFSTFLRKMREEHNASIELNNKKTVNTDVTIANDPNDPENRIYVFVGGIPIAEVRDVELDGENTILIDHVGEFVANIKKMYLNSLNGKPIQNKQNGNETDQNIA